MGRVEKRILLRAPKTRVWRAQTAAEGYGTWFPVALDGELVCGARVAGHVSNPGYEHVALEVLVEPMDAV